MNTPKNQSAGGDIRVAAFVKEDTTKDNTVVECGAGDIPTGISQIGSMYPPTSVYTADPPLAAVSGYQLNVFCNGQQTLLRLGTGGCTAGDFLKPAANGTAIKLVKGAGTKEYFGARALQSGTSGQLVQVQVVIGSETTPV